MYLNSKDNEVAVYQCGFEEVRGMLISEEIQYFQGSNPLTRRDGDDVSDRCVNDSSGNSVPCRYRDGMGGVNLEKVKRDQRQARKEVVRAMIRSLRNLRRH